MNWNASRVLSERDYQERLQYLQSQLTLAQWLLPILLFLIAASFESMEHLVLEPLPVGRAFLGEVFFFGILGPVTVALVLRWISGQVSKREEAEVKVRQMNVELEQMVEERTRNLETAYRELARKNEELKELDRLKSEFVSLVSHELRAPLTNINGGLELILQFSEDMDPELCNTLKLLSQQSERLTRLVENILDVSMIEAGKLPMRMGPVALLPLFRRVVVTIQAKSPRTVIRVPRNKEIPFAWADEDRLIEILINLLDNAAKYSPEWAPITIDTEVEDDHLLISVSDWGIGIPKDEQDRIFDRFYRVDNRDAKEMYGYGLGLYMTKKLVEGQGGRIWVESQPGIGSTFFFTLPLAENYTGKVENGYAESIAY